ncbi:MAG: hypothetical protein K8R57_10150 [Verrucomicrobia bacterium]|nr:hypothetical protein [Verrucomicrobiota bacterium]
MKPLIFKFLRILPVALIMFFSIKMMGFSDQQGIIAALIPVVLGMLDLMVGLAFGVTAIIFVAAMLMHVFPDQTAIAHKIIGQHLQASSVELKSK